MKASYRQDNEHFHYHNENPKNRLTSGDCVIRAISYVSGFSWDSVYASLCDIGFRLKMMPNDKKVFEEYLKQIGFTKFASPRKLDGTKYTVKEFMENNSDAKMIISVANHLTAIDNGKIIDTWDCGYKCVGNYWMKIRRDIIC